MEDRPEENPWKHKGRLKWVSLGDVVSYHTQLHPSMYKFRIQVSITFEAYTLNFITQR